ncbi:MAG: hypothetical protein HKN76_19915 [Saprospiraceae bacterium]|nr:hypothetical protein [Saprospiraceae bacterium]
MIRKKVIIPKSTTPTDPQINPGNGAKKQNPQAIPEENPRPDTFPAKENERAPGVKRKNLPHDPIKSTSKTKEKK